jgi:predicted nucleic acid-binding protein
MIFLDANILLEVILKDRLQVSQVQKYLSTISGPTVISMLSVHLLMHFGRKGQVNDEFLHAVINENEILTLIPEDYIWATANERGRDFEDALQVASAVRAQCEAFITLDTRLARAYGYLPMDVIVP